MGVTYEKMLVFLSTLIIVLSVLVGCNESAQDGSATTQGDSTDSKATGTNDVDACLSPEYSVDDLDSFIDEWVQAQLNNGENQVNGNGADSAPILVPVLKSDEYQFFRVIVRDDYCKYLYLPSDPSKLTFPDSGQFETDAGITVVVSRIEGQFDTLTADLTPVNGVAYDPEVNIWYTDNDGIAVSIRLPKNVILQDASELNDYFTFETYGGSGDDGTVAE